MMEPQLVAVLVVSTAVADPEVDKVGADPRAVDSSVVLVAVVVAADLAVPMVVDPDKEAVAQVVLLVAGTGASCVVELDQTAHLQPAVVPAYLANSRLDLPDLLAGLHRPLL